MRVLAALFAALVCAAPSPASAADAPTSARSGQVVVDHAIIDHDLRFELRPPPGTRLLTDAVMAQLNPNCRAGFSHTDPAIMTCVSITPIPAGSSFLQALDHTPAAQVTVAERTEITFAGAPAVTDRGTVRQDGPVIAVLSHQILHAGHIVGVQTHSMKPDADLARAHETAMAAVTLLPGPIRFREPPWRPAADRIDLGWRIKAGTLESALTGLRATPAPGWTMTTSREQARVGSAFELGFHHPVAGGFWFPSLGPAPMDADDMSSILHDWLVGLGASPLNASRTRPRGAWGPVALELWSVNGVEVASGWECEGGLCLGHFIEATGPLDDVLAAWERSPPTIEVLDEAARAALAAELAAVSPTLRDGSPSWSIVGDTWWHRTEGIGARLPRDLMIRLGVEVQELGYEGLLVARDMREGSEWAVTVGVGRSLRSSHRTALSDRDVAPDGRSRATSWGAVRGLVTAGSMPMDDGATRGEIATLQLGDRIVHVIHTSGDLEPDVGRLVRHLVPARRAGAALEPWEGGLVDPWTGLRIEPPDGSRVAASAGGTGLDRRWTIAGPTGDAELLAILLMPLESGEPLAALTAVFRAPGAERPVLPLTEGCPPTALCNEILLIELPMAGASMVALSQGRMAALAMRWMLPLLSVLDADAYARFAGFPEER